MTTKELRDLDAWIAEHVMGWKVHFRDTALYVDAKYEKTYSADTRGFVSDWRPTLKSDQAMEVFKKCLEKLAFGIAIQRVPAGYAVFVHIDGTRNEIWETLELTICLFAKKLFGGTDA